MKASTIRAVLEKTLKDKRCSHRIAVSHGAEANAAAITGLSQHSRNITFGSRFIIAVANRMFEFSPRKYGIV